MTYKIFSTGKVYAARALANTKLTKIFEIHAITYYLNLIVQIWGVYGNF